MKQNKHKKLSKKVFAAITAGVILLSAQLAFNVYSWNYMRQSHTPAIIPLIATALDGLYKPAAVDAKTGDNYFPEARLYVNAQPNTPSLVYNYNEYDGKQELTITGRNVLTAIESKLWSAYATNGQNESKAMSSIFDVMPGSQACARGVQFFYEAQSQDSLQERFIKKLANGKTVYAYTEPACKQDLSLVVAAAQSIQSY